MCPGIGQFTRGIWRVTDTPHFLWASQNCYMMGLQSHVLQQEHLLQLLHFHRPMTLTQAFSGPLRNMVGKEWRNGFEIAQTHEAKTLLQSGITTHGVRAVTFPSGRRNVLNYFPHLYITTLSLFILKSLFKQRHKQYHTTIKLLQQAAFCPNGLYI